MSWLDRVFGAKHASASTKGSEKGPPAAASAPQSAAPKQASCRDGDKVNCGKCGRILEVKYQRAAPFAVADPKVVQNWALRCQGCGFICCTACALGPSLEGRPVCPSCKAEGGPYLFS
jgi:hypothetical protein